MPSVPPLAALLLPLSAVLHPVLAANAYTSSDNQTPHDNNADCNCYVVESGKDSNTPEYFQYYRFYDFRNLQDPLDEAPPEVDDTQIAGLAPTWQPSLFNSDAWNTDWTIQNWTKKASSDFPIPLNNSAANIYLQQENGSSFLTMRTARQDVYQTAGEMENNQKNVMHASMRMSGRVVGSSGAVAGFFTFFDDTNEQDIEVLTRDPTDQIRYTNQPAVDKQGNEIAAASVGPTGLPKWDEWQTHRLDWLPKNSYWFLNGNQVAANTYSVPRKPSYLVLNMWSDGGEWSGNMTVGDSAEFQIQWIEMTFNTSGPYSGGKKDSKRDLFEVEKRASKGCEVVCKIDGVKQIGTPEVVSVNKSAASGLSVSWGALVVVGVVSMVLGL